METKGVNAEIDDSSSSSFSSVKDSNRKDVSSQKSMKKRRERNLGKRTPIVVRALVLAGYLDIARRGFTLLSNVNNPSWTLCAKDAILVYTLTYTIETLIAIYPGWISMEGVDFMHMWEHHIPCMLIGLALTYFLFGSTEDVASNFLSTARVPFSVGLVTQLCESYFVFRTFQSNPNAWIHRVIQRIFGFVLVSSFSLSVQYSLFKYISWKKDLTFGLAEFLVVPTALYLALILHPMYIRKHFRKLKLLFGVGVDGESKKK
jgi:hypothetical protein